MKTRIVILTLAASLLARADFSYTLTQKGAANTPPTKHYLKGQKMMMDTGRTATLMDFDAQTVTRINNADKTYTVQKFSEVGSSVQADIQADVKSTGQKKMINGFNASEVAMTMQVDASQARAEMKMEMEIDIWISPDVPGAQELRAFYQKNLARFPWAAMAQGGNPGMQKAMADLQRKLAEMNGVPVLETVKMKSAGGSGMTDAQAAQMAQARAKFEEMQKQGGPQAQAAAQALARMGAASGGGSGMEITMESSSFSTASIPDSVFAIPAGYRKTEK